MITECARALRWCAVLAGKFFGVAPGSTMLVIIATLISEIGALLAFFLPLKIVILLASEGVPRFFPQWFAALDPDTIVIWLGGTAVGMYFAHLIAERIAQVGADRGAGLLLAHSEKMVLFEGQDEMAANAYRNFARMAAKVVFIALVFGVVGYFYQSLAVVAASLMLLGGAVVWGLYQTSKRFRAKAQDQPAGIASTLSMLTFLAVFGFVLADVLQVHPVFGAPPGVLTLIVSIVLFRRMLGWLGALVGSVVSLYGKRHKLEALFFHHAVLIDSPNTTEEETVWPLLDPAARDDWLAPVLGELLDTECSSASSFWHQTGIRDVPALRVTIDGHAEHTYLVKLFDANRSGVAMHEASLLADPPVALPAPHFVGATQVGEYHCHVFRMPVVDTPPLKELPAAKRRVLAKLMAVTPPKELIERFLRSKPLLWQRFEPEMFQRLRVAADTDDALKQLEAASGRLEPLQAQLKALPLVLSNPNVNADTLLVDEQGWDYVLHWGDWGVEPLGKSWPTGGEALDVVEEAIQDAAAVRPELAEVRPEAAELAALADEFERAYTKQQYTTALELLPGLMERLDALERPQEAAAVPGRAVG